MTAKTKVKLSWHFYQEAYLCCELDFTSLPKLPESEVPVEVVKRAYRDSKAPLVCCLVEKQDVSDLDRDLEKFQLHEIIRREARLIEDARLNAFDQGYDARSLTFEIEYTSFHGQDVRWVLRRDDEGFCSAFALMDKDVEVAVFKGSELKSVTQLFDAELALVEAKFTAMQQRLEQEGEIVIGVNYDLDSYKSNAALINKGIQK